MSAFILAVSLVSQQQLRHQRSWMPTQRLSNVGSIVLDTILFMWPVEVLQPKILRKALFPPKTNVWKKTIKSNPYDLVLYFQNVPSL